MCLCSCVFYSAILIYIKVYKVNCINADEVECQFEEIKIFHLPFLFTLCRKNFTENINRITAFACCFGLNLESTKRIVSRNIIVDSIIEY